MKIEFDFNVETEEIVATFTPHNPSDRVILGAMYKSTNFKEIIEGDCTYKQHFMFKKLG